MYERKRRLDQSDPELVNSINSVIHDFNGLFSLMSMYSKDGEKWDTNAKEYWDKKASGTKDRVKKMCDILYEKTET